MQQQAARRQAAQQQAAQQQQAALQQAVLQQAEQQQQQRQQAAQQVVVQQQAALQRAALQQRAEVERCWAEFEVEHPWFSTIMARGFAQPGVAGEAGYAAALEVWVQQWHSAGAPADGEAGYAAALEVWVHQQTARQQTALSAVTAGVTACVAAPRAVAMVCRAGLVDAPGNGGLQQAAQQVVVQQQQQQQAQQVVANSVCRHRTKVHQLEKIQL